jgi:hypothetical protein
MGLGRPNCGSCARRLHLRGTPATKKLLESFTSVGSVANLDLDPSSKHSPYSTLRGPARTIPQFNGVHSVPYDTKADDAALR